MLMYAMSGLAQITKDAIVNGQVVQQVAQCKQWPVLV